MMSLIAGASLPRRLNFLLTRQIVNLFYTLLIISYIEKLL
jgi:hypothetical protein